MLEQPDTWKPLDAIPEYFDGIDKASGLDEVARGWVRDLIEEYESHRDHNSKLLDYYDGNVKVSDYGVSADITNDQKCHWPRKAVTALSDRITLESLTTENGDQETLDLVTKRNNIVSNYNRHLPAKLLYGCMAASVNKGANDKSLVRFHSAETFTAFPSPDFTDGVIAGGLVIARRERTSWSNGRVVPTLINLHTPGNIGEFRQVDNGDWKYTPGEVKEELPTLYVFSHRGTGTLNPFGQTRITQFVRSLTDDAIRCLWHMQISGAFYSMAKMWVTGVTESQFDEIMDNKAKYQLSRMLAFTGDGTNYDPKVGQLSGNTPQPFIDELRALACQFSGESGVPLNSLGIVQDNPSSAEAIGASREDICLIAERDIEEDSATLERVARAALAVEMNTTTSALEDVDIIPKFASPMLHSMSEKADWAVKINSLRPGFGETDVAARMVGLDEADLASVRNEERKNAARDALFAEMKAKVNDGEEEARNQAGDDLAGVAE